MFVPMRRFLASAPHRRWLSTNPWTRPVGEGALLLRFGTGIDDAVSRRVLAYKARLEAAPPLAGVTEVLPAYASLLVHFDATTTTAGAVVRASLSASSQRARAVASTSDSGSGATDAKLGGATDAKLLSPGWI